MRGGPRPFPRVNGYLLIPLDEGFLVGQIEWLTIERSAFPKRRGMQDFGLVDLPFPLRRLSLSPLGTLRTPQARDWATTCFPKRALMPCQRSARAVVLPTEIQLPGRSSSPVSGERVKIGYEPARGRC